MLGIPAEGVCVVVYRDWEKTSFSSGEMTRVVSFKEPPAMEWEKTDADRTLCSVSRVVTASVVSAMPRIGVRWASVVMRAGVARMSVSPPNVVKKLSLQPFAKSASSFWLGVSGRDSFFSFTKWRRSVNVAGGEVIVLQQRKDGEA